MSHNFPFSCRRAGTWLAGCSTPGTRVVLLPQEGGAPSASRWCAGRLVEVPKPQSPRIPSRAGSLRAPRSVPRLDQADAAKVRAENRSLFEMLPPRPQRYTLYFDAGGTVLTGESQKILEEVLVKALASAAAATW